MALLLLVAGCASDFDSAAPVGPTAGRSVVGAAGLGVTDQLPSCDVSESGFSMHRLPQGTIPVHSSAEARNVAERQHVGPEQITDVAPAIVTDPTGIKLGLRTTARVMWIIFGDDVHDLDADGPVPHPPGMTPGAVTHVLTLVDDETLELGGNFACGH
jgi:hypothetical protein